MPNVIPAGSLPARDFPQKTGTGYEAELEYRIALSNMQAEAMLMSDKPPIQLVMHYQRMDSRREREEVELIKARKILAQNEAARIAEDAKTAEAYANLMDTISRYQGREVDDVEW